MPGLAGQAATHGTVGDQTVRGMAARLAFSRLAHTLDIASAEGAAMACDADAQDALSHRVIADDGAVLGIDGEIFSVADPEGATSELLVPGSPGHPAADLMKLYRRFGIEFAARARGHFALAVWDGPAETLFLASDRFGMRPLYYRQHGASIAFASEVKALLTLAPAPHPVDEQGICDYILFGIPLCNRSFFADIQCVPPASILTFRNGRPPAMRRYWELEFHGGPGALRSVDAAARALKTTLQDVMEEAAPQGQTLELPISGGLDTRCIATLAVARGSALRTYSIGSAYSEDLRVGPLVAQQLGLPNHAWTLTPRDFIEWTEEAVYLTDGMYNPIDSPILFIARRLPGDARVVLDGASSFDGRFRFLDPLLFRLLPSLYPDAQMALKALVAPLVQPGGETSPRVLHPGYEPFAREHALAALRALAESVPAANQANPFDRVDFIDLRNRLPRCNIMGSVLLRSRCEVRHPFFDPRVVDLVTRFRPFLRAKEKLVLGRLIHMAAPQLAALVYERTGIPADSHIARHLLAYGKTALLRGTGRFLPATGAKPRVAIDFGAWVQHDPSLQRFIRAILLDAPADRPPRFRRDAVDTLLTRLFNGHTAHLPLVGRMISLELWHRYFLEHQPPPPPAS